MKNLNSLIFLIVLSVASFVTTSVYTQEQDESGTTTAEYIQAFQYVRDSISLEAYSGILRGSEGTGIHGSGNSLDKALLLFDMLRKAGYSPKLAYGQLGGENLQLVIRRSLGLDYFPESDMQDISINPESKKYLEDILRDHYWIQLQSGEDYINLDPTLPENNPGTSIASFRKQLSRAPSHLFQRIEINVTAEFSMGGRRARSRLLRYIGSLKDLVGKPIVLLFVNREADGAYKYSSTDRFYPVLWAAGEFQPALNLKVEANRLAVRTTGTVPPLEVHKIQVEYSYKVPGRPDVLRSRTLFSDDVDRINRLNELTVITVSTNERFNLPSVEFTDQLIANAVIAEATEKPEFASVLTAAERETAALLLRAQSDLGAAIIQLFNSATREAERCAAVSLGTMRGIVLPQLVAVSIDPESGSITTDILHYDKSSLALNGSNYHAFASGFVAGVMATASERYVLELLTVRNGEENLQGLSVRDALFLTNNISRLRGAWKVIDLSRSFLLNEYRLPPQLLRQMEESLRCGKILILPDVQIVAAVGLEGLAWWEVDSRSATAIGMISPGIGGAVLQERQLESSWGPVAMSYNIQYSDGWPQRLASLSRLAATALQSSPGKSVLDHDSTVASSILEVHSIISAAMATDEELLLPEPVREFFSPRGRMVLEAAVTRLCRPPGLQLPQLDTLPEEPGEIPHRDFED